MKFGCATATQNHTQSSLTMMSPYYKRSGNVSRKQHSTWEPVTTQSGEVRGKISFEGSIRAVYKDTNNNKHLKGTFTLERWTGSPTRYRISYDGFNADTEEDTAGDIKLPRSPWNPVASKGVSNNMKARLMLMNMNSNETEDGLATVQIMIPVVNGGHRAAKTVLEAFVAADIELRSTQRLVGRRV